jgi:hypothetical protein
MAPHQRRATSAAAAAAAVCLAVAAALLAAAPAAANPEQPGREYQAFLAKQRAAVLAQFAAEVWSRPWVDEAACLVLLIACQLCQLVQWQLLLRAQRG